MTKMNIGAYIMRIVNIKSGMYKCNLVIIPSSYGCNNSGLFFKKQELVKNGAKEQPQH